MSPYKAVVNTQLLSEYPNLVFEELAERLNKFEVHCGRKAANVVMCLHSGRRASERNGLDHIRIESSLQEPFDVPCAR